MLSLSPERYQISRSKSNKIYTKTLEKFQNITGRNKKI